MPCKESPADLVSRDFSIDQLNKNSQWLSEPDFLKESPDNWQTPKFKTPNKETMDIKKSVRTHVTNHVVLAQHSKWCLDPKLYSTWIS